MPIDNIIVHQMQPGKQQREPMVSNSNFRVGDKWLGFPGAITTSPLWRRAADLAVTTAAKAFIFARHRWAVTRAATAIRYSSRCDTHRRIDQQHLGPDRWLRGSTAWSSAFMKLARSRGHCRCAGEPPALPEGQQRRLNELSARPNLRIGFPLAARPCCWPGRARFGSRP